MTRTLRARAKVNLRLHVLGKRSDGYHELRTVFDRISLADTLVLERRPRGITLEIRGASPDVPADRQNLAWRGAATVLEAAGCDAGVALTLEKGVPSGAGLGGGSADAAAAMIGALELHGLHLPEPVLLERARALGADVPFFVFAHLRDRESPGSGRMAHGSGVGEHLQVLHAPPAVHYVLLNPGFEVSTSEVFRAGAFPPWHREGTEPVPTENMPTERNPTLTAPPDRGRMDPSETFGTVAPSIEDVVGVLHNDLEPVTASLHPEVERLRDMLTDVGALGARMSGSGPTVFGVFASEGDARRAADEIQNRLAGTKTRIFLARGE